MGGRHRDVEVGGLVRLRSRAQQRGVGRVHVFIDADDGEVVDVVVQRHADLLAQGVAVGEPGEHLFHEEVRDHGHVLCALHVAVGDRAAGEQVDVVDGEIGAVDAHDGDVRVLVAVLRLAAARALVDGVVLHALDLLGQGVEHVDGEQVVLLRGEDLHGFHVDQALLHGDGDVVDAQGGHRVGDGAGDRVAHAHDADDRADADDDAQHREQRAHLVGPQAVEGKLDVFKQQHPQHLLPCARP